MDKNGNKKWNKKLVKKVEANKITLISKKKEEQMKGYMWDKRRKLYEKGKKGKKLNGKNFKVKWL